MGNSATRGGAGERGTEDKEGRKLGNGSELSGKEMALAKAQTMVSSNPVVVFSKSYCPYCRKVKDLLKKLGAKTTVYELDEEADGDDVQSALQGWTGQRTVPNVFIGGKHIGGCDATVAKNKSGDLVPILKSSGALA